MDTVVSVDTKMAVNDTNELVARVMVALEKNSMKRNEEKTKKRPI